MKTTKDRAGAVVGKHRVCLVDMTDKDGKQSHIPREHGSFSTTPLRSVEVREGVQTCDFRVPLRDKKSAR